MTSFLLDTNVISEFRKGERADPAVRAWISGVNDDDLFLSVLVVGEIRKGVERVRRRDKASAQALEAWLQEIRTDYAERMLPVTIDVAEVCGRINVPDPLPVFDSLIAATARVHGCTVVTRNVENIARTGVPVLNPFDDIAAGE